MKTTIFACILTGILSAGVGFLAGWLIKEHLDIKDFNDALEEMQNKFSEGEKSQPKEFKEKTIEEEQNLNEVVKEKQSTFEKNVKNLKTAAEKYDNDALNEHLAETESPIDDDEVRATFHEPLNIMGDYGWNTTYTYYVENDVIVNEKGNLVNDEELTDAILMDLDNEDILNHDTIYIIHRPREIIYKINVVYDGE